jgi:hypothetical protein
MPKRGRWSLETTLFWASAAIMRGRCQLDYFCDIHF